MVGFSSSTRVTGWDSAPPELRAPFASLIHLSFDLMVAIGTGLVLLGAWQAWVWKRRREIPRTKWFLVPVALAGAGSILAMEAGWIVTEVGRQPWVVYGQLLTKDAVTTAGGVPVTLAATMVLYGLLTGTSIGVPWLMGRRWRAGSTGDAGSPVAHIVPSPWGARRGQTEEASA
jgi:cytochrome d ubiquinol oxidase subunit I